MIEIEIVILRLCETPPSPPAPDPVGIENCKQLFLTLLAFTTQKIATRSTDIISAARVPFFWVVNATRNKKSCLQFLIPTAVFHMLLKAYDLKHGFIHTSLTTSVEGGVPSFGLCPGIRFVTTHVVSIGKSFEIDDTHLLTALGTHCQCQLWRQYNWVHFTLSPEISLVALYIFSTISSVSSKECACAALTSRTLHRVVVVRRSR